MEKQKFQHFLDLVEKYGNELENGSSKKANNYFDNYIKEYVELKENSKAIIKNLKNNINHKNIYIQLTIASLLLEFDPEVALKKLKEISKIGGLISFSAKSTIEEWEGGDFEFPPYG